MSLQLGSRPRSMPGGGALRGWPACATITGLRTACSAWALTIRVAVAVALKARQATMGNRVLRMEYPFLKSPAA
jgi:hypothetical protein